MRPNSLRVCFRQAGRPATQSFSLLGMYSSVHPGRYVDHATYGSSARAGLTPTPATSSGVATAPTIAATQRAWRRTLFLGIRRSLPRYNADKEGVCTS